MYPPLLADSTDKRPAKEYKGSKGIIPVILSKYVCL